MQNRFSYLSALLMLSCLGTGAAKADEVVLYSSNNIDVVNTVIEQFRQVHPEISVSVVRAGSGALMQRIKAEAEQPLGDLFWSGGFSTLSQYAEYLAPYSSPEASAVGAQYQGAGQRWLGTNTHVTVLMLNERQLGQLKAPASWADLADPAWKGKIVIPDPERSSSSYVALYGLQDLMGQEVFEKVVRNAVVVGTTSGAYEGVANGEFAVAVTMEYAAYQYVAGGLDTIDLVYPKEGTFLSPEGMALVKGGRNPESARKLYDFLASRPAQEEVFKSAFRRPLRSDIAVNTLTSLPAMDQIRVHALDDDRMGADREAFLARWRALVSQR